METKILNVQKRFTEEGRNRISDESYIELYSLVHLMDDLIKEASEDENLKTENIFGMRIMYMRLVDTLWNDI